eukprot:2258804-Prymnesium_polylepis.2
MGSESRKSATHSGCTAASTGAPEGPAARILPLTIIGLITRPVERVMRETTAPSESCAPGARPRAAKNSPRRLTAPYPLRPAEASRRALRFHRAVGHRSRRQRRPRAMRCRPGCGMPCCHVRSRAHRRRHRLPSSHCPRTPASA